MNFEIFFARISADAQMIGTEIRVTHDSEINQRPSMQWTERREISLEEWQSMGFDINSVFADPMFVDPENYDYRVKPESPALKVGFKNFEMGNWGLTDDFPEYW